MVGFSPRVYFRSVGQSLGDPSRQCNVQVRSRNIQAQRCGRYDHGSLYSRRNKISEGGHSSFFQRNRSAMRRQWFRIETETQPAHSLQQKLCSIRRPPARSPGSKFCHRHCEHHNGRSGPSQRLAAD